MNREELLDEVCILLQNSDFQQAYISYEATIKLIVVDEDGVLHKLG